MVRWLIVIPLALLLAVAAGALAMALAWVVDPVLIELTGRALFVFWKAIFAAGDDSLVVDPVVHGLGRLALALLVVPPVFSALVLEFMGVWRLIAHAGLTALVTAAVPFLLRGPNRGATPEEIHIAAVLALVGAVAGAVYWAVAGRGAGAPQREVARILSAKAENRAANE